MAAPDPVPSSEPTRWCIAGGFALAVALASIVDPAGGLGPFLAQSGPFGLSRVDKWVHALSYGTLAVLVLLAARARRRRFLVAACVAVVVFGGAVELVQGTIVWRSSEFADVVANAVGAVAFLAGVTVSRRSRPIVRRYGDEEWSGPK